jgi:hypothetical protein
MHTGVFRGSVCGDRRLTSLVTSVSIASAAAGPSAMPRDRRRDLLPAPDASTSGPLDFLSMFNDREFPDPSTSVSPPADFEIGKEGPECLGAKFP